MIARDSVPLLHDNFNWKSGPRQFKSALERSSHHLDKTRTLLYCSAICGEEEQ